VPSLRSKLAARSIGQQVRLEFMPISQEQSPRQAIGLLRRIATIRLHFLSEKEKLMHHSSWGPHAPTGFGPDSLEAMFPVPSVLPVAQGEMEQAEIPTEVPDEWDRLWIDLGGEG
jgi:hypothetical protein